MDKHEDNNLSAIPSPKRRRRGPRKVTAQGLENAALFYLQRFATSRENLRRVLLRRVERSARHHGTDSDQGAQWIEALLTRFAAAGLLDDRAYAEGHALTLWRRGMASVHIAQRLAEKGVERATIKGALDHLKAQLGIEMDVAAATNLARRRRLGPFRQRPSADLQRQRQRDLAALARAGFSYEVAQQVLDGGG